MANESLSAIIPRTGDGYVWPTEGNTLSAFHGVAKPISLSLKTTVVPLGAKYRYDISAHT